MVGSMFEQAQRSMKGAESQNAGSDNSGSKEPWRRLLPRCHSPLFTTLLFPLVFSLALACSSDGGYNSLVPHNEGSAKIPAGDLSLEQNTSSGRIELANGEYVQTKKFAGQSFVPIEGMIDNSDFENVLSSASMASTSKNEAVLRINHSLKVSLDKLKEEVQLVETTTYSDVGFFTSYVLAEDYDKLRTLRGLPYHLVVNPVVTKDSKSMIKKMDTQLLQSIRRAGFETDGFSGLRAIGEPQFRRMIQKELGHTPDGSSVKVGVADTGLTLNHPTFDDESGKTRIIYMKDFTNEGRVYINPTAKFSVSVNSDAEDSSQSLDFEADVLPSASSAFSAPIADAFVTVKGTMLVSKTLREKLLKAGNGAKLGVLLESSWNAPGEVVDFNLNGSTKDVFYFLVVPEDTGNEVYAAFSGKPDFRKSPALRNWNDHRDSMQVISEKVGVGLSNQKLLDQAKKEVEVLTLSLLGFDPGNHGSHVSGIIGGRKTIQNDLDKTLARGVAPNAALMMNRVCANNGGCQSTNAIVDLALNGADIINMSLGGLSPFNDGYSVQEAIINRLTELKNVLFVISAGNSGPSMNTTGSPANARHALSVGAAADPEMIQAQYKWPAKGFGRIDEDSPYFQKKNNDFMLFFSSRGPNAVGGFKPNLTAPGTELSAIQLNGANGMRSGLDVYWGTSMSAPTATGAIALLLDAVHVHNQKSSKLKLPVDVLTLKKVLIDSAAPFDVTRFDTSSQSFERGQYTWVDQGTGMINLPRAWKLLKKYAKQRLDAAVSSQKNGVDTKVALDYQVRVLDTYRNGNLYNGSQLSSLDPVYAEMKFGRGLWLEAKDDRSLFQVHVARRLPVAASLEDDYGDLRTQLLTTMDEFSFKTVIYGSKTPWVKAGVRDQYDCQNSPELPFVIVGEGATDRVASRGAGSDVGRESALNICVDRSLTRNLSVGDHGALIFAYRTVAGQKEKIPSFIVPVYLTVPHKVLSGKASYVVDNQVTSFGVSKNYINVPVGTNLVKVSLEVPEAMESAGVVENCSEVRLYVNEASNSVSPPEISGPNAAKAILKNCTKEAAPSSRRRRIEFSRVNPNPGIWDLHVFGRYAAAVSDYRLKVDFAKIAVSKKRITGTPKVLNGKFDFEIVGGSIDASPSERYSSFQLNQMIQSVKTKIADKETIVVPRKDGSLGRTFAKDVSSVEIVTGSSPGNDIDLVVMECRDKELEKCSVVGQSGTSTDEEKVRFTPKSTRFYVATVIGYDVSSNKGKFVLAEVQSLKRSEEGLLSVNILDTDTYEIEHVFDTEKSKILARDEFLSGAFDVGGVIKTVSKSKDTLTEVSVRINKAS